MFVGREQTGYFSKVKVEFMDFLISDTFIYASLTITANYIPKVSGKSHLCITAYSYR